MEKWVDYYKVLGVKPNSTSRTIRERFIVLVKKYHPDLNREDNTEERMKQINTAYSVLMDEEKRREYDAEYAERLPMSKPKIVKKQPIKPPKKMEWIDILLNCEEIADNIIQMRITAELLAKDSIIDKKIYDVFIDVWMTNSHHYYELMQKAKEMAEILGISLIPITKSMKELKKAMNQEKMVQEPMPFGQRVNSTTDRFYKRNW